MRSGSFLILTLVVGALGAGAIAPPARAANARITGLRDVSFGLIAGTADQTASQNVCAFSSSNTNGYSVSALGSAGGGAFELSSGSAQLPYEVLWADSANQSGGTSLVAGTTTGGFISVATRQTCNRGPRSSASLTVVIRSATLSTARAGTYTGTLQITIAPE